MKKNSKMVKVISFLTKYWYVPVFVVVLGFYLWKKKKVKPINKDVSANDVLSGSGIKEASSQDRFKSYAAQIAKNLGTSYSKYDPRYWSENDEKVYELLKDITTPDFNIIKQLYFTTYAKGRDLSTDLANMLNDKYYRLLRVK